MIQKKAGDTLEAARSVLAEEQVAANRLFAKAKDELTGTTDRRTKFQEWKEADARADDREDEGLLTAEEALDLEIDTRARLRDNPGKPWEPLLTDEEENLLATKSA